MTDVINCHGLKVAPALQRFVDSDVLPGTGLDSQTFWGGFAALVHELAPINRALLAESYDLKQTRDVLAFNREYFTGMSCVTGAVQKPSGGFLAERRRHQWIPSKVV